MTAHPRLRGLVGTTLVLTTLPTILVFPARAAVPKVKVLDATVKEGETAVFKVRLKRPAPDRIVVRFKTEADTATAGADYKRVAGKLVFRPGQTKKKISVKTLPDADDEPDEIFTLRLTKTRGAKFADPYGTGTIVDDDPPPPVAAGALVINEVDYDQPLNPDFNEFVEILNVISAPIDISNVDLILTDSTAEEVNGRIPLSGSLAAGDYVVAGNPGVTPTPDYTFPDSTMNNAGGAGVALLDTSTCVLIDALSYTTPAVTAVPFAGCSGMFNLVEGTPTSATDSGNGSLIRSPNGTDSNNATNDWAFTSIPTPGTANP